MLEQVRETGLADELLKAVAARVRRRKARQRAVTSAVAALVVCLALGAWAIPFWRSTATVETPAARRQTFALADGSQAELNARSHLHTDFRYGRRVVSLERGEAFFSVAKDAAHPFFVETPAGVVRVTGTQFNLRLLDPSTVEVTLLEGHVEVKPSAAATAIALVPGQQFASTAKGARHLNPLELASVTSWREGRLVLDGLTLAQAAARMADYHGARLEVAPEMAEIRLGGSCALDDLPQFLAVLRATKVVRVVDAGNGTYQLRPQ